MNHFKIGVMVESFRLGLADGIRKAAAVGAQGIQLYAVDLKKEIWTETKAIVDLIQSNGLLVSALCSEMGGFARDPALIPGIIEKTRKIMALAPEMGTRVVTAHIGRIPEDTTTDQYKIMRDACMKVGENAVSNGVRFAIETGPETAEQLKQFLDQIGSKGLGVNYDPANLVMLTGDDPVRGVYTLKDYIIHTHAKDGVKLDVPADNNGKPGPRYRELPLGQGKVDFPRWIQALKEIGYDGFLTIEREAGDNPEADICMAIEYLNGLKV